MTSCPSSNSANLQNTREGNGTDVTTYAEMTAALQAALVLMKAANPGDLALQQARSNSAPRSRLTGTPSPVSCVSVPRSR